MTSNSQSDFDRASTMWGAIIIATLAMMSIGILPLVLGLFSDHFELSLKQTGILATAGQSGFGIGCLLVVRLRRLPRWRRVLVVTSIVAAVLNGLVMMVHGFTAVCSLQLAFGIAGGVVTGFATYVIGRGPRPERAFGVFYLVELAGFSLFAIAFSMLRVVGGFPWALGSLGGLFLLGTLLVRALPDCDRPEGAPGREDANWGAASMAASIALAGVAIFEIGIFALWVYAERIGTRAGIAPHEIGNVMALSGITGMAGAGTATMMGNRFGRRVPLGAATLAVLVGNAMLWTSPTLAVFAIAVGIFNYGWLLGLPYYMGAVSIEDTNGAFTSLLAAAQAFGGVAGPIIAAAVVGDSSIRPVVLVSSGACLIAMMITVSISSFRGLSRSSRVS